MENVLQQAFFILLWQVKAKTYSVPPGVSNMIIWWVGTISAVYIKNNVNKGSQCSSVHCCCWETMKRAANASIYWKVYYLPIIVLWAAIILKMGEEKKIKFNVKLTYVKTNRQICYEFHECITIFFLLWFFQRRRTNRDRAGNGKTDNRMWLVFICVRILFCFVLFPCDTMSIC